MALQFMDASKADGLAALLVGVIERYWLAEKMSKRRQHPFYDSCGDLQRFVPT